MGKDGQLDKMKNIELPSFTKGMSMYFKATVISLSLLVAQAVRAAVPAPIDAPPTSIPPIADTATPDEIDASLDDFKPEGRESAVPHPDFNPYIGNKPSDDWHKDMYQQLYKMKEAAYSVKKWGYDKSHSKVYAYGYWLEKSLDQYLKYTYEYKNGQYYPKAYKYKNYSYYATRGDHNYYYYYYVRPIYYQIYREIAYYSGRNDSYYKGTFSNFSKRYKSYTRCNYGYNGDDAKSNFDTESELFEKNAGL
ncbi:MAG TPA: hypothetical protein VFO10_21870 [Oligoflexus sp.]|uniref:hypothetical protein n=1 Tax=Oligoflexus sp. TaxID=1971216 RepID=UPI002D80E248|nr:hypothetical protein [Oligoflexus sp.]HET9239924.1 hypothetical protein [Oligoflexus sp.]